MHHDSPAKALPLVTLRKLLGQRIRDKSCRLVRGSCHLHNLRSPLWSQPCTPNKLRICTVYMLNTLRSLEFWLTKVHSQVHNQGTIHFRSRQRPQPDNEAELQFGLELNRHKQLQIFNAYPLHPNNSWPLLQMDNVEAKFSKSLQSS